MGIGKVLLLHILPLEWPAAVQNPERPDHTYRSPFQRVYYKARMSPIDSEANQKAIITIIFAKP